MGCDIHFYVERRDGDKWVSCDTWLLNSETGEMGTLDESDWSLTNFYTGRNYSLFAMLADVRNGSGFAGLDSGDGFVPIHYPRGIPDDASPEYLKETEAWDGDAHSHSWATVKELIEYDWTRTSKMRGWVSATQFAKHYMSKEPPEAYSLGVSGNGIQHFSVVEMTKYLVSLSKSGEIDWTLVHKLEEKKVSAIKAYAQIEWEVPYYREASNFLSETMPKLWRLGDPEDVRALYFFDN